MAVFSNDVSPRLCPRVKDRCLSLILAIGIATTAVVAAGAADAGRLVPAEQGTPAPPGVQTRTRPGSGPLPEHCSPAEIAFLISQFLDAFNRGDQSSLEHYFPDNPARGIPDYGAFNWYAVAPAPGSLNPGFVAYNRDQLLRYFEERHDRHEVLKLLQLEVAASWTPGVDIVLDIERSADDFHTFVAGTKGAIDCQEQKIIVWSMGIRDELPNDWFTSPVGTPVGVEALE